MELVFISVLLLIAAETSYLVAQQLKKEKKSIKQQHPIFVDTSVLIDGRIVAIAQSGFVTSPLFIPRSVVGELQFLADNADTEKRSRARHGLDVINELQAISRVQTEIFDDGTKAEEGVDNRLLKLAKEHNGAICTIDYNLNKVAQVEGLDVLNVNDLAMSLRMAYLPGEKTMLELGQKGNDAHQAIGHLPDGTMVVVEHASQYVGKIMEVEFIRGLQTAAGKMMFARVAGNQQAKQAKQPQSKQKPAKEPRRQPQPTQAAEQQPAAQPVRRPQNAQNKRRRVTNEDRLVELANKND